MAGSSFCSCFTYMFSWKGAACVLFRGRWSALASCSPPQPRLDTLDAHCIPTGFSSIASPSSSSPCGPNGKQTRPCSFVQLYIFFTSDVLICNLCVAVNSWWLSGISVILLFSSSLRSWIHFVRSCVCWCVYLCGLKTHHNRVWQSACFGFSDSHLQLLVHPRNSCLQCS